MRSWHSGAEGDPGSSRCPANGPAIWETFRSLRGYLALSLEQDLFALAKTKIDSKRLTYLGVIERKERKEPQIYWHRNFGCRDRVEPATHNVEDAALLSNVVG